MSSKGQMLQDPFLNALRGEHIQVSIYLVNSIKLQGQIESFDQYRGRARRREAATEPLHATLLNAQSAAGWAPAVAVNLP